jgi:hypothetical protein
MVIRVEFALGPDDLTLAPLSTFMPRAGMNVILFTSQLAILLTRGYPVT